MNGHPLKLLIIDRNRIRASIIEEGLSPTDTVEVLLVDDMKALMQRVVSANRNVIIMDLESPDRDMLEHAFQVTRVARRPIAMFVDTTAATATEAAIDAGVSAYVVDGLKVRRRLTVPPLSASIAGQVSKLTKAHLRKDPTITAVAIDYVDPEHWFAGGQSLAEQGTRTFWLDIKVVDGTNTKQELAAYLEAVYARMADLLGGVHGESYILVHEVPAAAYGFAGRTQEFRFIAGKLGMAA